MAYSIRKISNLDLKPSTSIGVALPFSQASAFRPVYTTKEQLKYNIINYLLTDRRERIFAPNFGAGLRSLVFEQMTQSSLEDKKATISSQIESYFPSVNVINFSITGQPDYNAINISFSYTIKNTNESDVISLQIQSA